VVKAMPVSYTVSAIISLYKGEKFIRGRLEDLLAQTLGKEVEIVIIDSNSPQKERSIIEEYLPGNDNIKYIRTDFTESMYAAWNRGISLSSGRYITNANADDRLAPFALERLVKALEESPEAGMVYGDYFVSPVENEGFLAAKSAGRPVRHSDPWTPLRLLNGYMCGPQSLWRRELHDDHGIMFDGSFEVTGDYRFVADISKVTSLMHIPEVLGVYYRSTADENKEFQNLEKTIAEAYKIKYDLINFMLGSGTIAADANVSGLVKLFPAIPVHAAALLWKMNRKLEINYETIYWIAAVTAERKGEMNRVKKIISKFANFPEAVYIRNYAKDLTERGLL